MKHNPRRKEQTLSFALSRMSVREASMTRLWPFSIRATGTFSAFNLCKKWIPLRPMIDISANCMDKNTLDFLTSHRNKKRKKTHVIVIALGSRNQRKCIPLSGNLKVVERERERVEWGELGNDQLNTNEQREPGGKKRKPRIAVIQWPMKNDAE